MRAVYLTFAAVIFMGTMPAWAAHTANGNARSRMKLAQRTVSIFENRGEAPADVLWEAHGPGFAALFSRDSFVLRVLPAADGKIVEQKISLAGANPKARIEPLDPLPGKVNFFSSSDPSHWVRGLATYSRLRYKDIYPGIDLFFYGNHGKLEYDFVVAPGADPSQIGLRVGGPAEVSAAGELQLGGNSLHRPVLYQDGPRGKQTFSGRFVARNTAFGFAAGPYDHRRPLIIDPTINVLYATYLGGVHDEEAYAMTLDSAGNAYMTGESVSQDYPVTANAIEGGKAYAGYRIVVTKVSPSGTLLYSTFLGGTINGSEGPDAITVDKQGNAWIAGAIASNSPTAIPTTSNAYQSIFPSQASQSVFFCEISPDGSSLEYCSYFAGPGGTTMSPSNSPSPAAVSIAIDQNSHVFLSGMAGPQLPTTSGAYVASIPALGNGYATWEPFVAAFDVTQPPSNQLLSASYFAPTNPVLPSSAYSNVNSTSITGMVLDPSGNPWILGSTYASNLPTTSNAIQKSITLGPCTAPGDPMDRAAYIAKLSSDLKTVLYASYLSGGVSGANPSSYCYEYPASATLDSQGNLYVTGDTTSSAFPTTAGAYQQTAVVHAVGYWQFAAKISSDGSQLDWATYLGQGGGDGHSGPFVGLDGQQNVWIASEAAWMPTTANAVQSTLNSEQSDAGVAELSSDGSTLLFGSYLPQIAAQYPYPGTELRGFGVDQQGNTYFSGTVEGAVIPVTPNAFQSKFANGDASPDGNDNFFMILGTGAISGVSPAAGGNAGDATVTLTGAGFEPGATCSLVQGATTIQATSISITNNGNTATCTFALNNATPGVYDVTVSNPDGSGSTDKGGFTVSSGGGPQVWTSISGRSAIRVNTPGTIFLNYGNTGNVNAYMTTIWLVLPSSDTYSISGLTTPSDLNCLLLSTTPIAIQQNGANYIPLVVPVIPAGFTSSIAVTITAPAVGKAQELIAYAERPWFDSLASANSTLTGAINAPSTVPPTCVTSTSDPAIADCLGPMSAEVDPVTLAELSLAGRTDANVANDTTVQLATTLQNLLNTSPASGKTVLSALMLFTQTGADLLARLYGATNACALPNFPNLVEGITPPAQPAPWVLTCPDDASELGFGADFLDGDDPCFPEDPVDAIDPNDKTGPNGDGSSSRWLRATNPLTYAVSFENEATATAPAGQVVVTDVLDPTKVDLTTLALSNIAFGTNIINIPANTNNYSTIFPINSGLEVRIQGSLNPETDTLKWTLTSIDPSTGLPPTDPTVGFLPPDANGVEGQGSVTFSVMPKSGQTTGSQITNQASVIFDANAPLSTDTWLNTLDVNPPQSAVTALPAQESQPTFNVSWSGADVGSGIATYTIYVSDNGGPYTIFQNIVTTTSASFTGQAGHTYAFYSIATDNAGNVEAAKSVPDTTTTVAGSQNASTTTSAAPASVTFSPSAQNITLTATVTSSAGIVNAGSVTFTLLGTSVSGAVTNGSASAAFTIPGGTAAGTYTIQATYNAAGDFTASSDTTHQLKINQAMPVIGWATPAAIAFGGALGSSQLDATANVPGTFVYTPPAGTVLPAGNGQTLAVTFTPTDHTDYTTANASVEINVQAPASGPANLVVTKTLSRNQANQVVVTVTIANAGGTTAANVELTIAKIGSAVPVTTLPQTAGSIAAGASAQVTLTFPAAVGTSGTAAILTLGGTYTGASFSSTSRITLP